MKRLLLYRKGVGWAKFAITSPHGLDGYGVHPRGTTWFPKALRHALDAIYDLDEDTWPKNKVGSGLVLPTRVTEVPHCAVALTDVHPRRIVGLITEHRDVLSWPYYHGGSKATVLAQTDWKVFFNYLKKQTTLWGDGYEVPDTSPEPEPGTLTIRATMV